LQFSVAQLDKRESLGFTCKLQFLNKQLAFHEIYLIITTISLQLSTTITRKIKMKSIRQDAHFVGGYGDDPEGAGGLIKDAKCVLTELRRGSLTGIAPADEVGASARAPYHEVYPGGVLLVPE
jgi:hypothetical protein